MDSTVGTRRVISPPPELHYERRPFRSHGPVPEAVEAGGVGDLPHRLELGQQDDRRDDGDDLRLTRLAGITTPTASASSDRSETTASCGRVTFDRGLSVSGVPWWLCASLTPLPPPDRCGVRS